MSNYSARSMLQAVVLEAANSIDSNIKEVVVNESKPGSDFDYQTPLCLKFGKSSLQVASQIKEILTKEYIIQDITISGNGFLNFKLEDETLLSDYTFKPSGHSVFLDFGGPNVAKPLHVGHLRSFVIGESLQRIFKEVGFKTVSDIHLGDWGLQMGMLIDAIQLSMPHIEFFKESTISYSTKSPVTVEEMAEIYREAAAACKSDSSRMEAARKATVELQNGNSGYLALWKALREESLKSVYKMTNDLGCHFSMTKGESDSQPLIQGMIKELVEKGIAIKSDGAIVIPIDTESDGENPLPPFILAKSDGASLYSTTDLATLYERLSVADTEIPKKVIYVVDQRQALHFEQLKRASAKVGLPDVVQHAGFGTVNGTDGKALKTRGGSAPLLEDLVSEVVNAVKEKQKENNDTAAYQVALGALKFADLSTPRISGYMYSPETITSFEGDTGPYIQYAAVRLRSILSQVNGTQSKILGSLDKSERDLVLECSRLNDAIIQAAEKMEPYLIAQQALKIAKAFNRFYSVCKVINAGEDTSRRILICKMAESTLTKAISLLGIEIPTKM